MLIDEDTIAVAHEKTVATIMKTCREIDIETSPGKWEKTWEYPDAVMVIIRHPQKEPQVSEACNFGPGFIAQYKNDLCHLKLRSEYPTDEAPVYTYPWRLMDYPRPDDDGDLVGNGDGQGINQIDQIVRRLVGNPESRRGNAITWVPEIDGEAIEDQPCLQMAHFVIREGGLHGRFAFRSHDMLGGAGANWVGLTGLMELVAQRIGKVTGSPPDIGTLTTFSSSAHLYWVRDWDDLRDFKKLLFEKYRMFV
jgi:thymidylate synthase